MADLYVDPSTGNDTTGDGSSGTPWKTVQKAVDNANGGNPDTIHIADTAADVLTTDITWNTGFTAGTRSYDNMLRFKGWDNGGSLTITLGDGTTVAAGKIDGNAAAGKIFSTTSYPTYVKFENLIFTNTTSTIVQCTSQWHFHRCEFSSGASTSYGVIASTNNYFEECYFHSSGAAGQDLLSLSTSGKVLNCFFSGATGYGIRLGSGATVHGNVIEDCDEGGINVLGDFNVITGNTLVGNTTTNEEGINMTATYEGIICYNNLIANYDGTSATGIRDGGGQFTVLGPNAYYNNTTDTTLTGSILTDRTAGDVSETSDPFTSEAGNDFSLVSGALSKGAGAPSEGITGSSTESSVDIGAAQREEAAGGGGGQHSWSG